MKLEPGRPVRSAALRSLVLACSLAVAASAPSAHASGSSSESLWTRLLRCLQAPFDTPNALDQTIGLTRKEIPLVPPGADGTYELTPLVADPEFDRRNGIVQLQTEEELAPLKLEIREGRLFQNHRPIDTRTCPEGVALYVMTADGTIYAGCSSLDGRPFRHSSFLAGAPVAGAGTLLVEQGVLRGASNFSGHYRPAESFLGQVLHALESQGVDTGGTAYLFSMMRLESHLTCSRLLRGM